MYLSDFSFLLSNGTEFQESCKKAILLMNDIFITSNTLKEFFMYKLIPKA